MFEQTQAAAQNTSESNNNSFMKVLDSYNLTRRSNGQSQYSIKTGFSTDNAIFGSFKSNIAKNAVMASISVTYGDYTCDVMMHPDAAGNAIFGHPSFSILDASTDVSPEGAYNALKAISKYIEKNKGKKYGSFFGLMRNSNSFVKYVLKNTNDDRAKVLGSLHSTFTAKGAANKVYNNRNNSNMKSVSIHEPSGINIEPMRPDSPAEGEHPVAWFSTDPNFKWCFDLFPELLPTLINLYNAQNDENINKLKELINRDNKHKLSIPRILGPLHSYGWLENSILARVLDMSYAEVDNFLEAGHNLTEAEKADKSRRAEEAKAAAAAQTAADEENTKNRIMYAQSHSNQDSTPEPSNTSNGPKSTEVSVENCIDKYNNAVNFNDTFREYIQENPEVNDAMLNFVNAKVNGKNLAAAQNQLGKMIRKGKISQNFIDQAKEHGIFENIDITLINFSASSPF